MSPIVSPKLLCQVMMHGYAAELSKASYVKILYTDLKARPVAVCKPTVIVLGSALPRRKRALAVPSNKPSYTSLPNANFIINSEGTYSEASLTSEEGSLISTPETTSFSMIDSEDEELERLKQVTHSTNYLEASPEARPTETCGSSVPSTTPSTCTLSSTGEPPSTTATSIPPWESPKHTTDPLQKFGVRPASTSCALSHSLVDSMDIICHRRASEATSAAPPSAFALRTRKYSDVRSLKGLGLRGLEILKRVKW